MEEKLSILEIAKLMAYNDKAEADAIQKYTELLQKIDESVLEEEQKKEFTEIINEIISDELNHEDKLRAIYVFLTGIEPNKE